MPRVDLIQYRRGLASQWSAVNPVLASGEVGFATDANELRVGDGLRQWADLPSIGAVDDAAIESAINDYFEANPVVGVNAQYVQDAIQAHRVEPAPHVAYDVNIPSLSILFQNGIT